MIAMNDANDGRSERLGERQEQELAEITPAARRQRRGIADPGAEQDREAA